jgi:isoquinoline 1-oxidoreductase subunit beta
VSRHSIKTLRTGCAQTSRRSRGVKRQHAEAAHRTAHPIRLQVNGKPVELPAVLADEPLLWMLRDHLDLRGTKFGCGHGGCGACLVHVDGEPVPSCTAAVKEVVGRNVMTIEGLSQESDHPVVRAWLAEQVPQCGYCQPGTIMAAAALLARTANPNDADIDASMSRVLCRCGTYERVRRAIRRAAEQRWTDAPFIFERLPPPEPKSVGRCVQFNPWIKIAEDGTVTVVIGQSEMGQGVTTSLPMLVAEELELSMSQVRTEFAPADHVYDNPVLGEQMTVGSMSVEVAWLPLRRAGAEVRERLIAAAARIWDVARKECRAENGTVLHVPSNRRLGYGVLASKAAREVAPRRLRLKGASEFRLLGKPTARLDIPSHVAGRTGFGMDVVVPEMLAATVVQPPIFGAKATHIDAAGTKMIPGVHHVLEIADGIAIVADRIWAALRGREALKVVWQGGDTVGLSNERIFEQMRDAASRHGRAERNDGNADRALRQAATIIEADYELPYLAHATIEPMNCTARVADGRCEVWVPTQSQSVARRAAAKAAGVKARAVQVHTTFLGGGFGRRSAPDIVTQAVAIAKAVKQPVQLIWSRAEDLQHDDYRPASFTRMRGGLDARGRPIAWFQRVVGPELVHWDIEIPYAVPHLRVECIEHDPGIPTGYWRSVGAAQNAFPIESFIDELAHAAGRDAVEFRLSLLESSPRHHAALELVAEKAGWGTSLCDGRARGVAVYYGHGGWAAQVAEVSVDSGGQVRVHRVVCAIDCGFVVNPDTVAAQMEGGIAFGLTAAMKSAVCIEDGRVVQAGFSDYPLLTLGEMPKVEVHIVPSTASPTGAGEAGVPPIAPAVANAVFAATGIRIRRLPINPAALRAAMIEGERTPYVAAD